jgi:hypothetical protein
VDLAVRWLKSPQTADREYPLHFPNFPATDVEPCLEILDPASYAAWLVPVVSGIVPEARVADQM